MTDTRDPTPFPEGVIPFPLHRRLRQPNPVGVRPILSDDRFVYDVRPLPPGYAVTYREKPITKHHSLAMALDNARLIASNFWSLHGQRTLVRRIEDDGTITVIVAFG